MSINPSERFNQAQQEAFVERERFRAAHSLTNNPQFRDVISFLDQERMWKGYFVHQRHQEDLKCSAVNLKESTALNFNPLSWQAEQSEFIESYQPPEHLSGLLIREGFNRLARIENILLTTVPFLPPESPVIVVEDKGSRYREGLDRREGILDQVGLVERSILIRPSRREDQINDNMVWRARIPIKRKGVPVNLIDEGPEWKRNWVNQKIQQAAKRYRQAEIRPLNAHEIGERLRESTYPLWDLGAAELGFGFELELLCGCQVKTTKKGAWVMNKECADYPDCDGSFLR